ncbi:MAG: hypothetical protein K8R99_03125 [Actinomycetia bacterium]|nr:hypothetical protein [Actinomycetes bacterium]
MNYCGNCGSKLPTGAAFCAECGRATGEPFANASARAVAPDAPTTVLPKIVPATPYTTPPPAQYTAPPAAQYETQYEAQPYVSAPSQQGPQPGRGGLLISLVLLGICAVGLGVYLVTKSNDSSTAGASSTIAGQTTIVGDSTSATTAASTIPVDPIAAATEQLSALVAQDRPTADTLVGSWVVQLSAKRVGLKADGIEYGPVEILANHEPLRSTYGAILVDGGAFQFQSGGNPMTGWFLTMVPQIYASKDEALQFCKDRGLASNVCLAREFKPPNP